MAKIESALWDLTYFDTLAEQNTPVHRLDARIKILLGGLFIFSVVSFPPHLISAMLPFALVLILVLHWAAIPLDFIGKKILLLSPFAIMVAICNPLLDQEVLLTIWGVPVSGGWLSFISILLRFTLTLGAMLALIACTGMNTLVMALTKLGMPRLFAMQILMLYRYIFVLLAEGLRMYQAIRLRSFDKRAMSMSTYAHALGSLLLRTMDRAQRIHLAMCCRGFDGQVRLQRGLHLRAFDLLVLCCGGALLLFLRFHNAAVLLEQLVRGRVM